METVSIGISDLVVLRCNDTQVAGEIVGITVWEGRAEAIKIKDIEHWFYVKDGWMAELVGMDDEIRSE